MKKRLLLSCVIALFVGIAFTSTASHGVDSTAAERGKQTLLTKVFSGAIWSVKAQDNAWKQWGLSEKPADYEQRFMERYGLHPAPYDNRGLAMGLRETMGFTGKGITNDCLLCHAGRVAGQSYIGLGNASLDLTGLYEEVPAHDGVKVNFGFKWSNTRGTIEAVAITLYLASLRDDDLKLRAPADLGPIRDDLCEDVPAWWQLKKKRSMYADGSVHARSVRSLMQFMLSPLNTPEYIKRQEPAFADIQAYILSLEPPKYPYPIDHSLAARGQPLFEQTCSKCHGTYGPDGQYPNKIVPMETIGTDRHRFEAFSEKAVEHYKRSWFSKDMLPDGESDAYSHRQGYQAPPLDGVWATAPYFHNASSPTVYHVLNSKARPKLFTRSYRAEKEDYDPVKLGVKITVLETGLVKDLPAIERRKVYDTTQPGRSNAGHTFGDKFSEAERMAVIEYLKTL